MATERRWIVLGQDGRHVTMGRAAPPSEAEVEAAATALTAQGMAGWLATLGGAYWARGAVMLEWVRVLVTCAQMDWIAAVTAFHAARRKARCRS